LRLNPVILNPTAGIAILYHIFYEDSCGIVCRELEALQTHKPVFIFNICIDTPGKQNMAEQLKNTFPGCLIIFTSNTGKDIGAKLAMLQLLLQLGINPDYLLLLHDKKSLQALKSASWKTDLLTIIQPVHIEQILQNFQQDSTCGIIAAKKYILKEPVENNSFTGKNAVPLKEQMNTYGIRTNDPSFVAGTMFWARARPLLQFFRQHNPLDIRKKMETGNVIDNFSGTVTHSWERLLSWIITAQKLHIRGI
jgi:lipopolysaccharide biosynthesis protein